jgi:hypothetical protein
MVPTSVNKLSYFTKPSTGLVANRATNVAAFWRPYGATVAAPPPQHLGVMPVVVARTPVGLAQTLDPFTIGIGTPAGTPVSVPFALQPYRTTNPFRDPKEQTTRGPRPALKPSPADSRYVAPPTVVDIPGTEGQMPKPGTLPPSDFHKGRKPRKRTKEKKLIVGVTNKHFAGMLMNIVTESLDVLDSFHKALPAKYQAKATNGWSRPSPQARAKAVFTHFEHLDWPKVVKNLITNQAEDKLYGQIGKLAGKANRSAYNKTGVRIQIQMGPAI